MRILSVCSAEIKLTLSKDELKTNPRYAKQRETCSCTCVKTEINDFCLLFNTSKILECFLV